MSEVLRLVAGGQSVRRRLLTAERAERLLRAVHRRVMRRTAAAIAAMDTIGPGEFLPERGDIQVALRLSDEAHRQARAVRRRVWGSLVPGDVR